MPKEFKVTLKGKVPPGFRAGYPLAILSKCPCGCHKGELKHVAACSCTRRLKFQRTLKKRN